MRKAIIITAILSSLVGMERAFAIIRAKGIILRLKLAPGATVDKISKIAKENHALYPYLKKHYGDMALLSYQWKTKVSLATAQGACGELKQEQEVLSCEIYSKFPYNKSGGGFHPYGGGFHPYGGYAGASCCEHPSAINRSIASRPQDIPSPCSDRAIIVHQESFLVAAVDSSALSCRPDIITVIQERGAELNLSDFRKGKFDHVFGNGTSTSKPLACGIDDDGC